MYKKYLFHVSLIVLFSFNVVHTKAMEKPGMEAVETPATGFKTVVDEPNIHKFTWDPRTLGTALNMGEDGIIQTSFVKPINKNGEHFEASFLPKYLLLTNDHPQSPFRQRIPRLELDQPEWRAPRISVTNHCVMYDIETSLIVDEGLQFSSCVFRTNSKPLKFVGQMMGFLNCFIDGNLSTASFTFSPLASLNSPIEYIKFIPRQSPTYIHGLIDFKTYTIPSFFMSDADIIIKFRDCYKITLFGSNL